MKHVVLLGDSVFDNAAYVRGGPDVVAQLRDTLPREWRATLAAVDGAVVGHVEGQLRRVPDDADYLVVSAGGNDALAHVDILGRGTRSMAEALNLLARIAGDFERRYRDMAGAVIGRGLPAALCTVYYPRFPDPDEQRLAVTALTVFNDAILRIAFEAGLPLLDLRLICDEDADYANPIEPSVQGGAKISRAITRLVTEHDFAAGRTEVFTR